MSTQSVYPMRYDAVHDEVVSIIVVGSFFVVVGRLRTVVEDFCPIVVFFRTRVGQQSVFGGRTSFLFVVRSLFGKFRAGRVGCRRLLVCYVFCFDVLLVVCALRRCFGLLDGSNAVLFLHRVAGEDSLGSASVIRSYLAFVFRARTFCFGRRSV